MLDSVALALSRLGVWLLDHLPERLALRLARVLIQFLTWCMPRIESVAERNLELVFPEKTKAERKQIYRDSLNILARNLLSYARLHRLSRESIDAKYEYRQAAKVLAAARAERPELGILMPTAHFGLFEELVQVGAIVDQPVSILARGFGLHKLDKWWNKRREVWGNEVFYRKGGYREIIRRLRAGQHVTLLCDQNVKANHAVFVELFGIPAATTKAMALATMRTGSPIVFVASIERAPGKFEIIAERIPNPEEFPGTPDEKVYAFTTALHAVLERCITERPDHWFWIHRRYKTRPAGEAETMYE